MHDFWRNQDPNERMNNMASFMKNLALAGAALALIGVEEPREASVPIGQRIDRRPSPQDGPPPGGVSFLTDPQQGELR